MIAIFSGETDAIAYSTKIHDYLTANRPGYNAIRWALPEISADGISWLVKAPPEHDYNDWGVPINNVSELDVTIGQTIPLPSTGGLCEINHYYFYQGDVLKCRQTHNRTIYEPKDTPALFSYFRDNSLQLQWISNEEVEIGWERIYNSIKYRCITAHLTQESWTPDITPTLWVVAGGELSEWVQPTGAHDTYNIGDEVIFENAVWMSVIDANVWSPTVYPAGWNWLYDL